MPKYAICYYCGAPSVDDEHVPPRVIFPESKDSRGIDYRKNLIIVSACSAHNHGKAEDDEFFGLFLATMNEKSDAGQTQFDTKVRRIVARTKMKYATPFFKAKLNTGRDPTTGLALHEVPVDVDRWQRQLVAVAKGLYFHVRKVTAPEPSEVLINGLSVSSSVNTDLHANYAAIRRNAEGMFACVDWIGENEGVFQFKILDVESSGTWVYLKFYGRIMVLAALGYSLEI